jgi:hypothetical protein
VRGRTGVPRDSTSILLNIFELTAISAGLRGVSSRLRTPPYANAPVFRSKGRGPKMTRMDFDLSEEQGAFRDAVSGFARRPGTGCLS